MKYLLDANVISEARKRERADANVLAWLRNCAAEDIGTSVLVLAELRRAIELKRRRDPSQAAVLDRWLDSMRLQLADRVLPVDEAVADVWARLSTQRPYPFVDGLLAATAKMHGLVLVTRNIADVSEAGVPLLNPFDPI